MKTIILAACVLSIGSLLAVARGDDSNATPGALNFTMKSLTGDDVPLSTYKGKVLVIVNTASKCGFTPQYEALEGLYKKYGGQGLVVLGFPANNFKNQEPGSDSDIATFCKDNYGVTFPMFSKISVKGDDQAPLYKYLTEASTDPKFPGEVKWNFEKFIIAKDGSIVNRFRSPVKPDSKEMTEAIEAELKK